MVLQPRALLLGSHGLGSSAFARHYLRNHGCFLFLGVLRWFTSPGSLRRPMDSDDGNGCSHPLGFPIRTSPDHSLLAAPRSFSQLTTSFFAYLRQGIHTHALSSLTITSTSHTRPVPRLLPRAMRGCRRVSGRQMYATLFRSKLVFSMPVNIQLSKIDDSCQLSAFRSQPKPLAGNR